GSFRAVDGISFVVPKGKVIGFLGPNGAGKTTTIQMLLGITERSAGSINYFGQDFFTHKKESLQRINSASAFNTLLGRISVMENLIVFANLYQVKNSKEKIMELIKHFEAEDLLPQRYWDLSSGQKTRVNLIKSLLNDPELLLMDEPTASLDPDITDKTLSLIEELKETRNLSILYTSHNMEEITRICDEVIFLDHGKIVAQDTPVNLTKRITGSELRLIFENKKETLENYLNQEKQKFSFENENTVVIDTTENLIPKLIFGLNKKGVKITDIEVEKPNLEDVFLEIARKDKNV
ncbi:MAG TPA: ABC transporter ATP-binding protein, partial [Patescibacteria group bacterium]|nr:ABC transporter ATP-binding protein [Patescibacteria group bacterium]